MPRRLTWITLTPLVLSTTADVDAADRFGARPAAVYSTTSDDALHMPTAVAVGPDGTVYVSDGVHDRVVVFSADGAKLATIESVGDTPLARPNGLHFDAQGRLWIADTGHARAVARNPDGTLAHEVRWPAGADATRAEADVTDVLLGADGTTVWLVDNDHHRLGRFDLNTGMLNVIGQYGESFGQFGYPFMIAPGSEGDVYVTDVLNQRAQVIDAQGRTVGVVGRMGVGLGELFRPKGLATDAAGQIWIVDGTLGVVQVFHPTGTLLGVVRDEHGAPLKLETPCGIALDAAGDLYVTELIPGRARKFAIERNPDAPLPDVGRDRAAGGQPKTCVVCHIEWIEPLASGRATPLMAPPPNPPDWPNVSRAEMCLSCHDTSIADSRLHVWGAHGHPTMVTLGEGITAPAALPLVDGKVDCRTCHSAHATGEREVDIARVVFLRQPADQMCMACHAQQTRGPQAHQHPIGEIRTARADMPRATTCQSCHAAHGATAERMLIASPNTNQLCLPCHSAYEPERFGPDVGSNHPLAALAMTAEQTAGARTAGLSLTADGAAVCLSCHDVHAAPNEHFLLQTTLSDNTLCRGCHADVSAVIDTPHDLRAAHPDAPTPFGLTVATGGTCSACHRFHGEERWEARAPLDPDGQCVRCHQAGGLAAESQLPPHNHPEARCTECHDPHRNTHGHFFAVQPETRCIACHEEQRRLVGGPHDVDTRAAGWPAASVQTGDTCLACHRPHADETTGLFRVAAAEAISGVEATCQGCHADTAPGSASHVALVHPRAIRETAQEHALPIATGPDGTAQLTCSTCHDPHRGAADAEHLLRLAPGHIGEDMCITCHTERGNIHMIGHAEEPLREAGFTVGSCKPCHEVHARPADLEPHYMWPRELSRFQGVEETPDADVHCRACHRPDGPVAPPEIATHPDEVMFNPILPDEPGYMPLFNAEGEADPQGRIACRTCHLTHGRSTPAPIPRGVQDVATRELRARQWHVRTFAANNVCTTCHGFDATRRFIYFHDPARRVGPLGR